MNRYSDPCNGFVVDSLTSDTVDACTVVMVLQRKLQELEDYITHHEDWVVACTKAMDQASTLEDGSYWQHQLETLKKLKKSMVVCQGVDGPCDNKPTRRRQHTAYGDDAKNWVTMCDECATINNRQWAELWKDYYSGCL